jgi:small subunit ribosomal protein S8
MYYGVLAQLKNALRARKEKITVPFSNMDFAVLSALAAAGFVKSVEREALGRRNVIAVRLAAQGGKGAFDDFKIVSRPSRHTYIDYRKLRPVRQGRGAGVISTSQGIMTDREARKKKIGGEYLFQIW